jgi:hypothetical protein
MKFGRNTRIRLGFTSGEPLRRDEMELQGTST